MRVRTSILSISAAAALALLAGCSGNGSIVLTTSASDRSATREVVLNARMGLAPQFLQTIHFGPPHLRVQPDTPGPKDLAVSDDDGAVEVLDHNFALEQTILDPTACPTGDFYDKVGRLYAADYCGPEVTEYQPSGALLFTYTAAGMNDPLAVATDRADNVYVADYGGAQASIVVEFPQGSNNPIASCSTGIANSGIAIDASGAVFVSGNNPSTGFGNLLEYPSGIAGCPVPITLGVTLGFAGGLQIDKAHNLVACDQIAGVDIIPPPYASISSTITGAGDSFRVALNRVNGKIFIVDAEGADVLVDLYPSGTPFAVLNHNNGLVFPAGVATNPYQQ
jgi:hypothetical protein